MATKKSDQPIAFMTGATGHLGNHLSNLLLDEGYHLRALVRKASDAQGIAQRGAEVLEGAMNDPKILAKGVAGATYVFHVAANVSFWNGQWQNSLVVNVDSTREIAKAARKAKVKRMVYTSSVSTLGKTDEEGIQELDETCAYNLEDKNFVYPHSKWLGEIEVLEAVRDGLDAVITHPSVILGPGDHKHHFKPVFEQAKKGAFMIYPDGKRNMCDVRDVARGHYLAALKGRKGERYVTGGETISNEEFLGAFAEAVGGPKPRIKMPKDVLRFLGKVQDALSEITGKEPLLTTEVGFQSSLQYHLHPAKAIRELGYSFRPFKESFQDTVDWYRNEGLIG